MPSWSATPLASEQSSRKQAGRVAATLCCLFAGLAPLQADELTENFNAAYSAYQQLSAQGDFPASLEHARSAYESGLQLFADEPETLAYLGYNYAANLLMVGRATEAEIALETTVEIYELAFGEEAEELIRVLMDLGTASATRPDSGRSRKAYKRAFKLAKTHYGKESIDYAKLLTEAAVVLLDDRSETTRRARAFRQLSAGAYLDDAFRIVEPVATSNPALFGQITFHIGASALAWGSYERAVHWLQISLSTHPDPNRPQNAIETATHAWLVRAYEELEMQDEATRHCQAVGRMAPARDNQNYQPLFQVEANMPPGPAILTRKGAVVVEFTVDSEGIVQNPRVLEELGDRGFAQAALYAIGQFRYAPRFENGLAVDTHGVRHRFSFAYDAPN